MSDTISPQPGSPGSTPPINLLTPPSESRLARAIRYLRLTAGAAAVLFGVAWSIYAKFGPYWPTQPEIYIDAKSSSSYRFPVTVKNDSSFFSMHNMDLNCLVTDEQFAIVPNAGVQWRGGSTALENAVGRDTEKSNTTFEIAPTRALYYACDFIMSGPEDTPGHVALDRLTRVTFVITAAWT